MSIQVPPRIAVLIRTHFVSQKLVKMLDELKDSRLFDVFVTPNESQGPINIPGCAKIAYSHESFSLLGFDVKTDHDIVYCSDLLFEYYRRCIPQYDFYALVEYDVAATQGFGVFFEELATIISTKFRDIDVIAARIGRAWEGWYHYPKATKISQEIFQTFFPFVILSPRAIEYLYEWRLREDVASGSMQDRVFCEALVVSVLNASSESFRWLDLNDVMPSSHSSDTFYFGLPMLDELISPKYEKVNILHPVYPSGQFLEVHYRHAVATGTLLQYRAVLEDRSLPFEAGGLAFWEGRINSDIAELGYAVTQYITDGVEISGKVFPPVFLLVDNLDIPLRDEQTVTPRVMAQVGSVSLLEIVFSRLIEEGFRKIYVSSRTSRGAIDEVIRNCCSQAKSCITNSAIEVIFAEPLSEPLGLRLKSASEALGGRLVVCQGHVVSNINVLSILVEHDAQQKPATATVGQAAAVIAALDADISVLLSRSPRRGTLWTDAGCLVMDASVWEVIDPYSVHTATDLFDELEGRGQLFFHEHLGFWQGANTERELEVLRSLERTGNLPCATEK